ncbi:MAG: CAP domain-containing protein [Pyrinomonadaceae bacterium]
MRIFKIYFFIVCAAALFPAALSAQKKEQKPAEKTAPKNVAVVSNQPSGGASQKSETAPNFSSVAQSVLEEINAARNDPQSYVKYLEDYKKLFKGDTVFLPDFTQVQTNEGTAGVDEAIEFLKTAPKLAPYKISDGLNQTSGTQLQDMMENSALGHKGKDGGDLATRLNRVGRFVGDYGENITHAAEIPRQIVMMMIIDDGVKSRGHRKNIFSPDYKVVGISFGKGKIGEGLCVVDFASGFYENDSKSGVREF